MKLDNIEITERIIGKADLSSEEAKVARVKFGLSTAGQRSQKWVEDLSGKKHDQLLSSAREKIRQTLETQGAGD